HAFGPGHRTTPALPCALVAVGGATDSLHAASPSASTATARTTDIPRFTGIREWLPFTLRLQPFVLSVARTLEVVTPFRTCHRAMRSPRRRVWRSGCSRRGWRR